jgi:hypothetical protein
MSAKIPEREFKSQSFFKDSLYFLFSTWSSRESASPQDIDIHAFANRCKTDHTLRDTPKDQLPCITPGGTFNGPRRLENLVSASGLVLVDIDKKAQKDKSIPWWVIRPILKQDPHVKLFKQSYSGGVHILVHAEDAANARQHIEKITGLIADRAAGTQANSLCYYSYDPNIYLAEATLVLKGHLKPPAERISVPIGKPSKGDLNRCERILGRRGIAFVDGQRNAYLYQLALLLKDRGHTEQDTISTIAEHYPDHRLEATVQSAYKHAKGNTKRIYTPEVCENKIHCEWVGDAIPKIIEQIKPGVILVIKARTGSGKTEMIPQLAKALKLKAAGIFPYTAQVRQRTGWEQLRSGTSANLDADLIATTWDRSTEISDMEDRLVIVDECENLVTSNTPGFREGTIKRMWDHAQRGKYVLFMSATPQAAIEGLKFQEIPHQVIELITPQRSTQSYTVHEMGEGQLVPFAKGASLIFRDHKAKNAELKERLVLDGWNPDSIGLIDQDTGGDLFRYISDHQQIPEGIELVISTRRIISGVNIRKSGTVRVIVLDPQNFSDLIQAPGRFAGGRGAAHIHLDVVFTQKPKKRKKYTRDQLVNHMADQLTGRSLFDQETLEALDAIQDCGVPISSHLRNGGSWAACYHAIADEINQDNIEAYLEEHGFTFRAGEAPQVITGTEKARTADQLEQRRLAWIQTMEDDLPAALGWKRAQRIMDKPGKYSDTAIQAALKTKPDDPGLPTTAEKWISISIRSGGLLDTFGANAWELLKETKQPEKVLARYRRRSAQLNALQAQTPEGGQYRRAAQDYCSALIVEETYTKQAIIKITEKIMGPLVKPVDGPPNYWQIAKMWWNLVPDSGKRSYTVYHFLDLEEQVINSKRFPLKPLPALKKRAQKNIKENYRTAPTVGALT